MGGARRLLFKLGWGRVRLKTRQGSEGTRACRNQLAWIACLVRNRRSEAEANATKLRSVRNRISRESCSRTARIALEDTLAESAASCDRAVMLHRAVFRT